MERLRTEPDPHFVVARGLGLATLRVKGYAGVDLDIAGGTAHALCGEDKSGKTELLLTLAGRMLPTEGKLLVDGIDASRLRGVDKLRKRAGLAFFAHVNDVERGLRVRTVTSAELSLAGRPSNRAATEAYLERWELLWAADHLVGDLDAYSFDLLGIALGMASDPQLLAVDDIESGLTDHQTLKLVSLLRDLAHDTSTTVVCGVTDYDVAAQFDSASCLSDDARAQRDAYLRARAHQKEVA